MAPHKAKPRTIFSEDILDDLAVSSPLRFVPAGLKLCVCVSAIILAVASPELWLPLFVSLGMAGAALIFARVPLKLYLSLLTIPLTFGLTGAVIILLLTGGGDPLIRFFSFGMYTVQITTASVHLALLVLARTLAGMCSLYFLAVTTPMISLFGVFSRLHFPQADLPLHLRFYRRSYRYSQRSGHARRIRQMERLDSGIFHARLYAFRSHMGKRRSNISVNERTML